jgi:dolichol-phosphate mannosyltransferase
MLDQAKECYRNAEGIDPSVDRPGGGRRLISVSVPILNEEHNLRPLLARLRDVAAANTRYDFEFVFTDNASSDRSFEILAEEARSDPRIRVFRFTRNFGFQASILTNFLCAKGNAAVQVDADLQDPPELISEFLQEWERGYKIVYGIRRRRVERIVLSQARKGFYRILNRLSSVAVPVDAGDFRLVDRVIIEHLRVVKDNSPYIRGIISELGYKQIGIPYDRTARTEGESKFRFMSLARLAIDGICSQSTKPLELISLFGFALSVLSFVGAMFYFLWFLLVMRSPPQGFTTIVILVLFSTGVNAAFIGILGEYIGRIFKNTRSLPAPIVEHRIEPVNKSGQRDDGFLDATTGQSKDREGLG